jgi:hypothetical protein
MLPPTQTTNTRSKNPHIDEGKAMVIMPITAKNRATAKIESFTTLEGSRTRHCHKTPPASDGAATTANSVLQPQDSDAPQYALFSQPGAIYVWWKWQGMKSDFSYRK